MSRCAFSLVEMLIALLVASLLMVAMAPVMTKKFNENVNILGVTGEITPKKKVHEIVFGSVDCPADDAHLKTASDGSQYCEGVFVVPTGYNGAMTVSLVGAGGGGAGGATAGYTEYKTAGNFPFDVPKTADNIEVTLVEGGAGGGAGWIDTDIKGFSWSFDSTSLDRNYVPTSSVSSNVVHRKVSGNSVSVDYSHGTGKLSESDTKYIAENKAFVTMAGGGGGGGRGYAGTGGGGGGAYSRQLVTVSRGTSHDISVGAGGAKHACEDGTGGCGGSASKFGTLLTAGGGGGGAHGALVGCPSTAGELGGAHAASVGSCHLKAGIYNINTCSGGYGAGNPAYNAPNMFCDPTKTYINELPGFSGGLSMFGSGGAYSPSASVTTARNGQGYGGGGCGAGGSSEYNQGSPEAAFAGTGAPGFVAVEFYDLANGGSGGGGASVLALNKIAVTPNESLNVTVGEGGVGGKKGTINSVGNFTYPIPATNGRTSFLKRGDTILGRTSYNVDDSCSFGACAGEYDGYGYSTAGHVFISFAQGLDASGEKYESVPAGKDYWSVITNSNRPGFSTISGYSAGNKACGFTVYDNRPNPPTLTVSDYGGSGGRVKIFGEYTCSAASGGRTFGQAGANGSGYGCGGGGGYGMADGGNGHSGYARISWNKFWKGTENGNGGRYELAEVGNGGGGASGNFLRHSSITVKSGEVIKIRIGKGGTGGKWSGSNYIEAQNGGNTEFDVTGSRHLVAGGGNGGIFPMVNNVLSNGGGGAKSILCKVGSTNYANNYNSGGIFCANGENGENASADAGGKGANSPVNTFAILNIPFGYGGDGANKGANNTDGSNASMNGFGGGGGGGGLKDLNNTGDSVATSSAGSNGGNGSNGRILLEWYEM